MVETRVAVLEHEQGAQGERLAKLEDRLNRMQWTLVGIFATGATSAVLLAINIIVMTQRSP